MFDACLAWTVLIYACIVLIGLFLFVWAFRGIKRWYKKKTGKAQRTRVPRDGPEPILESYTSSDDEDEPAAPQPYEPPPPYENMPAHELPFSEDEQPPADEEHENREPLLDSAEIETRLPETVIMMPD